MPKNRVQAMDIKALRTQYKSGERDFQGQDLGNLDLSFFELSDADFSGSKLSRANLRAATLVNTNFAHCDLTYADLSSADLSNANLCGADLSGANLSGAILINVRHNAATRFPLGVALDDETPTQWLRKQAPPDAADPKTVGAVPSPRVPVQVPVQSPGQSPAQPPVQPPVRPADAVPAPASVPTTLGTTTTAPVAQSNSSATDTLPLGSSRQPASQQTAASAPNPGFTYGVSLASVLILALLAGYYQSIGFLNSLEIFWLILVLITCTLPSFTVYQNKPSFPNLISAIGVPLLGVINAILYQGAVINGWWLIFFIAPCLLVFAQQSRFQNSPTFSEKVRGDLKPINTNNLIAAIGFLLNVIIVANYAPAYQYYIHYFWTQGNKGWEVFGTLMGLLGFLLWSTFSFYYSSTLYGLTYNKNWFLKALIGFGLPVLGVINIFRDRTNFFTNWWLVLGLGGVLIGFIITPAVTKSPKV
jgi:hypothetical protein